MGRRTDSLCPGAPAIETATDIWAGRNRAANDASEHEAPTRPEYVTYGCAVVGGGLPGDCPGDSGSDPAASPSGTEAATGAPTDAETSHRDHWLRPQPPFASTTAWRFVTYSSISC